MNFRRRIANEPITLQLAPMIDVILFLLIFFLLTWNFARNESDLTVRLPNAKNAAEPKQLPGEVVLNIRTDGAVILNRRPINAEELKSILAGIVKEYPDQPVVVRADENVSYKHVVAVLDLCRAANLWNIAFATAKPEANTP
jgi:biopolymer transport protein ExbD